MMITFLAFSFRSYFSSPSLWLNTSQLWEWNFKQSLGWERYVSFQDRDTITMQSVDACWGGQRSQTDHRYNKYRTRQSRRPAVSHCHFLWHVDEVLLSLISRSWSGLYGDKLVLTHKNTQTHSFQDSLRAISWAMQFVESAGGGGGWLSDRLGRLQLESSSVSPSEFFSALTLAANLSFFPEGFVKGQKRDAAS